MGGGCAEWLRCAWGGGANAAGPPNAQLGALMSGFPLHFCTGLRCFPWERGEWGKAPLRGGTKGVARPTATHPSAVHPSATHPGTASPPSHLPLKSRLRVLPDPNLVGFTPDGAQGTGNISTPWCRGAMEPQHPNIPRLSVPALLIPASHIWISRRHTSHIPSSQHCTTQRLTSQRPGIAHPTSKCPGTAYPISQCPRIAHPNTPHPNVLALHIPHLDMPEHQSPTSQCPNTMHPHIPTSWHHTFQHPTSPRSVTAHPNITHPNITHPNITHPNLLESHIPPWAPRTPHPKAARRSSASPSSPTTASPFV